MRNKLASNMVAQNQSLSVMRNTLLHGPTHYSDVTASPSICANGSNVNLTTSHPNAIHFLSPPVVATMCSLIQLFGTLANVNVIYITTMKQKLRTTTNWIIFNLAVSDVLVDMFCIPLDIPLILTQKWIYGDMFCRIYYPIGTCMLFSSAFTLVILACTRCRAIVYPFQREFSIFSIKLLVVLEWLLSFGLVLPIVMVLKHSEEYQVCYEDWRSVHHRRAYTLVALTVGYAIPVLIITVSYVSILKEIVQKNARAGNTNVGRQHMKENKKLVKVSLLITISFIVCILPNQLVWLLYEFGDFAYFKYHADIRVASHVVLFLQSALNPFIYIVFSSRGRAGFRESTSEVVNYLTRKLSDIANSTSL